MPQGEWMPKAVLDRWQIIESAAKDVIECLHGDDELPRSHREVLDRLRAAVEGK